MEANRIATFPAILHVYAHDVLSSAECIREVMNGKFSIVLARAFSRVCIYFGTLPDINWMLQCTEAVRRAMDVSTDPDVTFVISAAMSGADFEDAFIVVPCGHPAGNDGMLRCGHCGKVAERYIARIALRFSDAAAFAELRAPMLARDVRVVVNRDEICV